MAPTFPRLPVRALLLDIEGTTTPIAFVHEVLFPFARAGVRGFLERNWERTEVRADVAALEELHAADQRQGLEPPALSRASRQAALDAVVAYVHWLMDRDSKATPLKSLQGKIWEEGYRRRELCSRVFPDVVSAFRRWRAQGRDIAIFSSGSVLAQKLLFAHTEAGDLTGFIRDYFDTTTGPKKGAESYRRIAAALQRLPAEVVFLSDVTGELDAASAAGMQAALAVRPGNAPAPPHGYPLVRSFEELFPE